jgi:hypothetical protein
VRLHRRLFLPISGGIAIIAALTLWWRHVPEPKLNGVGLGHYLDTAPQQADLPRIIPQFGLDAVPYLAKQIEPDPIRELVHRASRKFSLKHDLVRKDWANYQQRRARALSFFYLLGPDGVEAALPAILTLAERPEDPAFYSALPFLSMALGTEHEVRAVHALIAATKVKHQSRAYAKPLVYGILPQFKKHRDIIMPSLIESLHEPGGYKRIDIVVSFGTNAIPALRQATLSETNHVRPASVALERILADSTLRLGE